MKTILVLDDEPQLRQLLVHLLQMHGYNVLQASNISEAMEYGYGNHVDLLIADVSNPCCGIDVGLALMIHIPKLKVVLTSGYPVSSWKGVERLQSYPPGSMDTLTKPYSPGGLWAVVRPLLAPAESAAA